MLLNLAEEFVPAMAQPIASSTLLEATVQSGPFFPVGFGWDSSQSLPQLSLGQGAHLEWQPSTVTHQTMASLSTAGDAPFVALESLEVAFQVIIGARQTYDIIAVKQARRIALRDILDML